MSSFWLRPLGVAVLVSLVTFVLWLAFGPTTALGVACGVLLLLWLQHCRNLYALHKWLHDPDVETVPQGSGLWEATYSSLYRVARQQSRSRHKLSVALERLRRAAEAIPDGLVVLDTGDHIEWCNPVAEDHFGIDDAVDRGRQITYLLRQPEFLAYLARSTPPEPLLFRSPRDRATILSVQIVPFGDDQKLLMSRDVTHLERVETMRRDFVANVSHELRTPLTVVGGFLETLLSMPDLPAEERDRFLNMMQEQTTRMQRLVDDLLTLSRLEGSQNPLQEERVAVPALVQSLCEEAKSLSGGRHAIKAEIESGCGLLGSENELRSAFGNLVGNAVRYTPDGGEIVLRWEERGGQAVFSVRDSGIGIEQEHIPRLTERFYRVDRSRSRETGGTGLGLSIVKHVLTRHQGRVEIASTLGQGSTFSLWFPARRLTRQETEQSPG